MTRPVDLDLAARPYARPSLDVRIQLSGNPCRVPACDYLAGDGYICPTCVESWEVQLGNVAALVEDLELAMRKQVRFGTREGNALETSGKMTSETRHMHSRKPNHTSIAIPFDLTAAYWLDRLHNELVGQIRLICDVTHLRFPASSGTIPMSRWLLGESARLPYLPEQDGWGLVHDLDQTYKDCVSAIDAPARKKYVRVCTCGLAVWATREKARCACGIEYDVEAEHEARMEVARESLVPVTEACDASGVKYDTLKKWIRRGRIVVYGKEPQRVRYGDVLILMSNAKEKTA